SCGAPPAKSGMAIGIGATLPCVTSSRVCASAGRANDAATAPVPSRSARRRVKAGETNVVIASRFPKACRLKSAAEHVTRIERHLDVLPRIVLGNGQEVERRAAAHRAQRALRGNLEGR